MNQVTKEELLNAGFKYKKSPFNDGVYEATLLDNVKITVCSNLLRAGIYFEERLIKSIETNKEEIEKEFLHFNQLTPRWQSARPQVGEIWNGGAFGEKDSVCIIEVGEGVDYLNLDTQKKGFATLSAIKESFIKTHDYIDDYYKEKYEVKTNKMEEIDEKFSYDTLKSKGLIKHDISGEDYDSIEAFKKLLSLVEYSNIGMKNEGVVYIFMPNSQGEIMIIEDVYPQSPIYFKSMYFAREILKGNEQLIKKFLKIKNTKQ